MTARDPGCEWGKGRYSTIALALLLVIIGWLGYKLVPIWYYYLDLRNQFNQVIRAQGAVLADEEIRRIVATLIKSHGIPAEERNVRIERTQAGMKIELPYRERLTIEFLGQRLSVLDFQLVASAEGRYR
jgi:hypothetical protein